MSLVGMTDPTGTDIRPVKAEITRTEFIISAITAIGGALSAVETPNWVISLLAIVATTLGYVLRRTDFAVNPPGWKTARFWTSLAVIVGAVATAITEATIPGVPKAVMSTVIIVLAALTALGYQSTRFNTKKKAEAGTTG